jgi:bifunctional N-acetylglucosamine-1-phosphate-uridyltransferase/glucosamine-1-phosphate-acetyltransferase GlmU-like protein
MNLLIVAAGAGKRLSELSVPKPLAAINGKPNVFNTVLTLGTEFEKIFIAISLQHKRFFIRALSEMYTEFADHAEILDKVQFLEIQSGFGSGHAVMVALQELTRKTPNESMQVMLTWGDAYFADNNIVKELAQFAPCNTMVVPVVKKQYPYISMSVDKEMKCLGIEFNADEPKAHGLHDQSIFLVDALTMQTALSTFHNATWGLDRYIVDIGEFGFLHIVHYLANIGNHAKAYITDFPLQSYNTMQELKEIQEAA